MKKINDGYAAENLEAKAASEKEFYIVDKINNDKNYELKFQDCKILWNRESYCETRLSNRLEPILKDIRDTCLKAGVDVEASQVEFGPGQIEFQLFYDDSLRMSNSQIKF